MVVPGLRFVNLALNQRVNEGMFLRYWIRYFIFHNNKRHPAEMGAPEVTPFLRWLAADRNVAAATQNQALAALLFLYKAVLERDLPWFDDLVRAKRPVRLPVVLSEAEARTS